MNSSSNYNCISADCARVVYREYLPPTVRWRYPNEEWQEIKGDDFSLAQYIKNIHQYFWYWELTVTWRNIFVSSSDPNAYLTRIMKVSDLKNSPGAVPGGYPLLDEIYTINQSGARDHLYIPYEIKNDRGEINRQDYYLSLGRTFNPRVWEETEFCIAPNSFTPECSISTNPEKDCLFTVTLNDEVVYTETRDNCPEVEKLSCRLDDISKEIKIEKTPYQTHILVIDAYFQNYAGFLPVEALETNYGNGFVHSKPLPNECLNIYKLNVLSFVPTEKNDVRISNTSQAGYVLEKQICSVPGCPPPKYEVICDCNEKCPEGTCEVYCGEYLCCYDPLTGKAVKSIHKSDIEDFGIPENTVGLNDVGGNFA